MDQKDLKQISNLIDDRLGLGLEKLEKKMFDWKLEIIDLVDEMAKEI